jgi:hypothetical protein
MNKIYMMIAKMVSENYNLLDLKQWLDISTVLFLCLFQKNTTNKSQVIIIINCAN